MALSPEMRTLHGRDADLELLAACLERAAAGTLQTVLVSGEAGIGKTSILNATLDRARERGFCVFIGHTDEIERARPFGPLAVAFGCDPRAQEPRVAELGRLLAGGPPGGSGPIAAARDPGLQFRMVDGFVDLVEAFAVRAPVVLALDDVQWADTSTLLAVRSLTRRLTLLPVVLLLALRPLPREPELERLVNGIVRDGAHELTLGPLGSDAVAGLVAELVAAKPGAELLEQVAGAAGNPLFVTELVRALAEEGAIDVVDGNAELLEVSLPPSLRLTILRRLSFLSAATLELLRVASLLGSAFSLRDVTAVAGQPATGLLPALRDAIRAGVLEERGARLAFRHDVVRAAIYEDIPLDARSALHLEAGRRLGVEGAPVVQVAEQFALGARPGDVEAVDWLHGAAREVARHAPPLGVELLERALELATADDDRPLGLLADLVPSLLWAGRPGDAEARAREALAHRPPPDLEGPIRLGLAEALFAQDRPGDVIREVDIATRGSDLTADVRSQLLAEAANALAFTGDLETAETTATKAVAIGTPVLSEGAEMGLLVLSDLAREAGKPDEALKLARDALEFAEQRVGSRNHWPPELFAAMALRNLDRLAEAQDTVRAGYQVDERLGKVSYLPLYHYESATVFFHAGQWDDAIAQARTGLTLADEVSLSTLLSWPYGLLALIDIHRGALDGATALVDAAAPSTSPSLVLASSLLDEARGAAAPALATLADAWDRDASVGSAARRRTFGPDLVRLAVAAGDHSRAVAVAAGMEEAAALSSVPSLAGVALRCRGLVEDDVELLLRSVEAYRGGPRVVERAAACEDAAAALARATRISEASALFSEALDVYDHVGAQRDAARALATMRTVRIGRKRRGARKRPDRGWESLTPSELEVVRLAAEGLTNPEIGRRLFISRRTVQTHLAHAFEKLNISSRVELAAKAARRGGV